MPVNKIEVLKTDKDGLDVLPDLHRYAALAGRARIRRFRPRTSSG